MVISSKGCHGDTILLYDKTGPIPAITPSITKHKSVFALVCGIAKNCGEICHGIAIAIEVGAADAAHVGGILSAGGQSREGVGGGSRSGNPVGSGRVKSGVGRQTADLIALRIVAGSGCRPRNSGTVHRLS